MKRLKLLTLAVIACCVAGQARAAEATPVKLALAHEIMVEQGAIEATRNQLIAMFAGAAQLSAAASPAARSAIGDAVNQRMQSDVLKLVPSLMIDVEQSYAEHLSEDELRGLLAWVKSPVAKAITAKLPIITREAMAKQQPRMRGMMMNAMSAAIEAVCEEHGCTSEDRQSLRALMEEMFPPPPAAI
jgi:hypothetical protein